MTTLYCRPTHRVALNVQPQAAAAPIMAAVDGMLAVELTVGLPSELSLISGGRDLDNYLFPLAQRLGPARIAAMFGQKVHGPSFLAIGQAQPEDGASPSSSPLGSPVPICAKNGRPPFASCFFKSDTQSR